MQVPVVLDHGGTATATDIDPAVLAFVKCHVTSPLKWETLRVVATRVGEWLTDDEVGGALKRPGSEVFPALAELAIEGVLEERETGIGTHVQFRLPVLEPTTVVLERVLSLSVRSRELRSIIAAHVMRRTRTLGHAA